MEEKKESVFSGYPRIISYDCSQKIMEQMNKNICKIKIGEEQGTGFFCKIPYPKKDNMLPVFITNNHIIKKDLLYNKNAKISIKIKENKGEKILSLNDRKKYTNEKFDITIIEIKEKDQIKNFLELDDNIIDNIINNYDNDENDNGDYIDETIYIIQYPEGQLTVSYGVLLDIFEDGKYNFCHRCSTRGGSSGSPILNLNNKVIGIHKECTNKYNKGTFLDYPIKDFIKKNYSNNNFKKEKAKNDINSKVNKLQTQTIHNQKKSQENKFGKWNINLKQEENLINKLKSGQITNSKGKTDLFSFIIPVTKSGDPLLIRIFSLPKFGDVNDIFSNNLFLKNIYFDKSKLIAYFEIEGEYELQNYLLYTDQALNEILSNITLVDNKKIQFVKPFLYKASINV